MATPEEQVAMTERSFRELAADGEQWPSLHEVALRSMRRQRAERRFGRSRGLNSVLDIIGLDRTPRKPSWNYRHQTALAAMVLEADGRVEYRFADKEGRLHRDPPGPRDARDRRYRLTPEVVTGPEAAPEDRFENLAQRIEALPGALDDRRSDGRKGRIRFAGTFAAPAPAGSAAGAPIGVDLEVIHIPVGVPAGEVEPGTIWLQLDATGLPGGEMTETYLRRHQFEDLSGRPSRQLDMMTAGQFDLLEDVVRAVELYPGLASAEAEMAELYERSLKPVPALPEPLAASAAAGRPIAQGRGDPYIL